MLNFCFSILRLSTKNTFLKSSQDFFQITLEFCMIYNKEVIFSKNDIVLCKGILENGLYHIQTKIISLLNTKQDEPNLKRIKLSKQ